MSSVALEDYNLLMHETDAQKPCGSGGKCNADLSGFSNTAILCRSWAGRRGNVGLYRRKCERRTARIAARRACRGAHCPLALKFRDRGWPKKSACFDDPVIRKTNTNLLLQTEPKEAKLWIFCRWGYEDGCRYQPLITN